MVGKSIVNIICGNAMKINGFKAINIAYLYRYIINNHTNIIMLAGTNRLYVFVT